MAVTKETRILGGGMNKDISPHLLKVGSYIDALNLHIGKTDNGVDLTAENVKTLSTPTNSSQSTYTLPTGINRIIGSWDDKKGNRTIIFLWNSENNHRLISYDYADRIISTILEDNTYSSVGWSGSSVNYTWGDVVTLSGLYYVCNYTHTSDLGNGPTKNSFNWELVGDYLDFAEYNFPQINGIYRDEELLVYWTDDNGEPKYINVDRYINGEAPTVHRKQFFYQIPQAPILSLRKIDYASSGDNNVMTNSYWQFRYQYEYWDGRKTTWSPISKIPMPSKNIRGRNAAVDNYIDIQVPRPPLEDTGEKSVIKKVIVAAIDVGDGNSGTWYVTEEIDATKPPVIHDYQYYDTMPCYYWFRFGGDFKYSIDVNQVSQLFSWIPKKAKSQEIIDENTLVLGGITEGNDNITPNPNTFTSLDVNTTDNEITISGHGYSNGEALFYSVVSGTGVTGLTDYSGYYAIVVDADTIQLASSYANAIAGTAVNLTAAGWGTSEVTNFKVEVEWTWTTLNGSPNEKTGPVSVFKRGHRYVFALSYDDGNGRLSDVITSSDLDVIVPYYNVALDAFNEYVAPVPTFKIYHKAPSWAKAFHISYSKSLTAELNGSTPSFTQFITWDALTYGVYSTSSWPMHNTNFIYFGLGYVANIGTDYVDDVGNSGRVNKFSGNNMSSAYTFNKGDRIRLTAALEHDIFTDVHSSSVYDTEILENDTAHEWLLLNAHDPSNGIAYVQPNYKGTTFDISVLKVRRGFDDNTYIGNPDNTDTYPPDCYTGSATTKYSSFVIEAYTPRQQVDLEDIFYYEFGEDFLCGPDFNGDNVHLGQSITSPNNTNQLFVANNQSFTNTDVTVGTDEIAITTHGYYTGQTVVYSVDSGTTLTGLTSGTTYYVIYVDDDNIQLATTYDNAVAGTPIDITGAPTGTFTLSSTPANIEVIEGGDCYLNLRTFSAIVDTTKLAEPAASGIPYDSQKFVNGSYVFETSSAEDYLVRRSNNSGRPNIIAVDSSQHKETEMPSTIRLSQPLINGTNINGFGMFYGLDFYEYNINYGWINKIYAQSEYMTIFQEIRTSTIPIGRTQWSDANGSNTVALSTNLLGKIQYFPQEYGIGNNSTSHAVFGSTQYFYDLRRSSICMINGGTIEPISEDGNDTWVDAITSVTSRYVYKPRVFATYDQEFMEYVSCVDYSAIAYGTVTSKDTPNNQIVITVPSDEWWQFTYNDLTLRFFNGSEYEEVSVTGQPTGAIGAGQILLTVPNIADYTVNDSVTLFENQKDTIAFSDKYKMWSGRYSFTPEMFGSAGVNMMSFNQGTSYVHNNPTVTTYGTFYGTFYPAEIQIPFNQNPDVVKQPRTVEIKTNNSDWSVSAIENNNSQASTIPNAFFTSREGVLSAAFLRDTNTLPTVTNALTRGNKLIGEYHTLTLKNTATTLVRLFSAAVKYIVSYVP
jgi:hypothetical protein